MHREGPRRDRQIGTGPRQGAFLSYDSGLKTRPSELFQGNCWISFEPVERSIAVLADYIGPQDHASSQEHRRWFAKHRAAASRGEASGNGRGLTGCYGLTGGKEVIEDAACPALSILRSHGPDSTRSGRSSTLPSSTRHAPQRPLPAPPNNRAVGQLVIRFGVPEGKSEVSYLSQFRLLNATDIVWLNL